MWGIVLFVFRAYQSLLANKTNDSTLSFCTEASCGVGDDAVPMVVLLLCLVILPILAGAAAWSMLGRPLRSAPYGCLYEKEYLHFRIRRTVYVVAAVSASCAAFGVATASGCPAVVQVCIVSVSAAVVVMLMFRRRRAVKRHASAVLSAALALDRKRLGRLLAHGSARFGIVVYEECYRTVCRTFLSRGRISRRQAGVLDMLSFVDGASARKVADEIAREYMAVGLAYAENRDTVDSLLRVMGVYLSPEICSALDAEKAAYTEREELWPIAVSDAVTDGRPCYYRHRVAVVPVVSRNGKGSVDTDRMEVADLYLFNDTVEVLSRSRRWFGMDDIIKVRMTEAGCLSIVFRNVCDPLMIVCEEPMVIRVMIDKLRRNRRPTPRTCV